MATLHEYQELFKCADVPGRIQKRAMAGGGIHCWALDRAILALPRSTPLMKFPLDVASLGVSPHWMQPTAAPAYGMPSNASSLQFCMRRLPSDDGIFFPLLLASRHEDLAGTQPQLARLSRSISSWSLHHKGVARFPGGEEEGIRQALRGISRGPVQGVVPARLPVCTPKGQPPIPEPQEIRGDEMFVACPGNDGLTERSC